MARVFTYMLILTGISILLTIAGVNTTLGVLTQFIGNSLEGLSTFQTTALFISISALLISLAAVGGGRTVSLGFISATVSEMSVVAVFGSTLLIFATDFVKIIQYSYAYGDTWAAWLIAVIMVPLLIGYLFSIIDWVRGRD